MKQQKAIIPTNSHYQITHFLIKVFIDSMPRLENGWADLSQQKHCFHAPCNRVA